MTQAFFICVIHQN